MLAYIGTPTNQNSTNLGIPSCAISIAAEIEPSMSKTYGYKCKCVMHQPESSYRQEFFG